MDVKSIKEKWFEWFHAVYATIVIAVAFTQLSGTTEKEKIFLWLFGGYFFVLLVYLVFDTYRFSRKARYAEANHFIHDALHTARDAYHYLEWCLSKEKLESFEKARFQGYIVRFLTSTSTAFSLVSATKCRASLKVIGKNDSGAEYISTLARDQVSLEMCREMDEREGKNTKVDENTDFHLIVRQEINYFFNGNLPACDNYLNSNKSKYEAGKGAVKNWSLPYRSTIVLPVRYVWKCKEKIAAGKKEEEKCQDIYGFLTVDSSAKNAFSERFDVQVGALLADAIFSIMNLYGKCKQEG